VKRELTPLRAPPQIKDEDALVALQKAYVDIVLLDFDLGHRDGGEFMRLARQQGFTGKVLVVTAGVEKEQTAELIRSSISGIFMKHDSASLLIEGIQEVLAGKVWFDRLTNTSCRRQWAE